MFDECEAAIGAKAEYELLAMPDDGDGLGVAAGSSSCTDLLPSAPVLPPAPVAPPDDAVLACEQDGRGFVTCAAAPWSELGQIARITSWPEHEPLERRNVSVKCLMHKGKCAIVRRRRNFSDNQLLRWVLDGEIFEHECSQERRRQLGEDPVKAWSSRPWGAPKAGAVAS